MKKRYYFFITFLILFFIFFIVDTNRGMQNVNKNIKYLDSLNVSLKGKIVSIKNLGRGSGLILVNLINSNYHQFDDRSRQEYFLVIKNNKAEIYLVNTDDIQINDTILIEKRNIQIFREDNLIQAYENGIGLTPKPNISTNSFYKNIKKAHILN